MSLPLYPVLFAAAFVLARFVDAGVSPYAGVRAFAAAVLGVLLIQLLASWMMRSWRSGAAIAGTIVLVVCARGPVADAFSAMERMPLPLLIVWLAMVGAILALAWRVGRRALRRFRPAGAPTGLLNGFAAALIAVIVVTAATSGTLGRTIADLSQGDDRLVPDAEVGEAPPEAPDIYVLLLDGYARADTLATLFDFDNRPFLDELERRGFDVAHHSRANYLFTHPTLAAMLHMRHLDEIPSLEPVLRGHVPEQPAMRAAINDNLVFEGLRGAGYQIVATAAGFEHVALRQADVFLDVGTLNDFEFSLLEATLVGDLVFALAPGLLAEQHRSRVLGEFDAIARVAELADGRPRLVFGHIPSPHLPVVFGPDGEPVDVPYSRDFWDDSPGEIGQPIEAVVEGYRGQVAYLNDRVIALIDDVLAATPEPPVIIVMSDHGPASHIDWGNLSSAALPERSRILFAAYTPGADDLFEDDITPVNVFARLLSHYLGIDVPAAANDTYAVTRAGLRTLANPDR